MKIEEIDNKKWFSRGMLSGRKVTCEKIEEILDNPKKGFEDRLEELRRFIKWGKEIDYEDN